MPEEITAAINANPSLRIELELMRPPTADHTKAYLVCATGLPSEAIVLSIPDHLWAQLGRRGRIVAQLSIEDEP